MSKGRYWKTLQEECKPGAYNLQTGKKVLCLCLSKPPLKNKTNQNLPTPLSFPYEQSLFFQNKNNVLTELTQLSEKIS